MLQLSIGGTYRRSPTVTEGRIGAAMFFVSGIVVLVFGGYLTWQNVTLMRDGATTKGTIVRYNEGPGSWGRTYYYPLIEYTDAAGKIQTFKEVTAGASTPKYRLKETVNVRYRASYPQQARIDSFSTLWMGPIVSVFMGLLFSIVGGFLILRELLNARR